jgi:hypothetical protein
LQWVGAIIIAPIFFMDIESLWHKALKDTEIIRARVQSLNAESSTSVPYVILSESSINSGDTVVRTGEIQVDKPSLLIPPHNPQFSGFDFEKDTGVSDHSVVNFLLIRGVTLPSLRYDNRTVSLEIYEGRMTEHCVCAYTSGTMQYEQRCTRHSWSAYPSSTRAARDLASGARTCRRHRRAANVAQRAWRRDAEPAETAQDREGALCERREPDAGRRDSE